MKRWILGLVVVACALAPQLAEASGTKCHEVSRVVGYRRCGGYAIWEHRLSISMELGITSLVAERPSSITIARTDGEQASTGGGYLDAHGFMFGYRFSLPHGL